MNAGSFRSAVLLAPGDPGDPTGTGTATSAPAATTSPAAAPAGGSGLVPRGEAEHEFHRHGRVHRPDQHHRRVDPAGLRRGVPALRVRVRVRPGVGVLHGPGSTVALGMIGALGIAALVGLAAGLVNLVLHDVRRHLMGDFDGGHRRSGRVIAIVLAVLVVGVGAGAAGIWIGRGDHRSSRATTAGGGRGVDAAAVAVAGRRHPGAAASRRYRRRRPGLDDPESRCGGTVLGHRPGGAVRVPPGPGRGGTGRGERGGRREVPGRNICRPVVGVGVPRRPRVRRPRRQSHPRGVLHRTPRPPGHRHNHPGPRAGTGRGRRGRAAVAGWSVCRQRRRPPRPGRCGRWCCGRASPGSTARTGSRDTRCGSRRCRCCWCGRPGTGRWRRSAAPRSGWTPWCWVCCRRRSRCRRRTGTDETGRVRSMWARRVAAVVLGCAVLATWRRDRRRPRGRARHTGRPPAHHRRRRRWTTPDGRPR